MDSLPTWAWWMVAVGVLLSPVFAFLVAILVEILIGLVNEGGLPALLALLCAGILGGTVFRKVRMRAHADDFVEDQA
jgi:hypothetical protein